MPIPKKDMGSCMSFLKHEKPKGFGKVKDKHKQRVAICMKQTGKTNEGMTFKEYLESLE